MSVKEFIPWAEAKFNQDETEEAKNRGIEDMEVTNLERKDDAGRHEVGLELSERHVREG